MGDGGVACMPLQQHQHQAIMERCQVAEKTLCGGSSNGLSSKPVKLEEPQQQQPPPRKKKKVIKVKKVIVVKKKVVEKKLEPGLKQKSGLVTKEKCEVGIQNTKELENPGNSEQTEEVEEGELGTLKWPGEAENGQVLPEKSTKIESERGQIAVVEECRKAELESGQLVSSSKNELLKGKIVCERKGEAEKRDELVNGESFMVKWSRAGKGEAEKEEIRSRRGTRDEIEKGEFIPERWHRGNTAKDDYNYKVRKSDTGKEKGWKYEQGSTPPDGKYSGIDAYCRKEISRSASQHSKSFARWETGHERTPKIGSKLVDEQGLRRSVYNQGKKHGKEYSSNRLKRPGGDTESIDRKHHGDYGDYSSSKNRRLSDDNGRTIKVEHYSRHSVERSYRNASSSRKSSSEKYSSRHHDSSFSSRVHHDKHGRSPGYPERSPQERAKNYDHQDRSPVHGERSPHVNRSSYARGRSPHARDRSPNVHEKSTCAHDRSMHAHERSPLDRSRNHYHRHRSPTSAEQSPKDRARVHERRDRILYIELSPNDQSRHSSYQRKKIRSSTSEKLISNHSSERQDDQIGLSAHGALEDLNCLSKEKLSNLHETKEANEKNATSELQKEEQSQSSNVICEGSPHVDGAPPEELQSMEEDMDICDTPPHNSVVAESSLGKWIYLDYLGFERGPSKLCEVKALVEEGALSSDHFIKHLDSDRWVTVENAASPLVTANFSSIASDCITQLVSPPEPPGNVLAESGDQVQGGARITAEMAVSNGSVGLSEPLEDLLIDERIEALLGGYVIISGRELETIGEALCMTFDQKECMQWDNCEDSACFGDFCTKRIEEPSGYSEMNSKDITAFRLSTSSDSFTFADSADWFCSRWACKGGDWKRSDEAAHDRDPKKKLVLNDGFPLCQMAKSGYEDPRWHQKDDLYIPSHSKRLDLPLWAFSVLEERNDCNSLSRSGQTKGPVPRSMKGTVLPVVRINACVVQDHSSLVSDSRTKVRGKDKCSSRSSRSHSASSDFKRSLAESNSQSKTANNKELQSSWKSIASISTPKDRVGTVDDLQLHLGEWFYLDGAGHEQGPLLFAELQALENQGIIQKNSSVFRKFDKIWVPISSEIEAFKSKTRVENSARYSDSSGPSCPQVQPTAAFDNEMKSNSFHSIHPQFLGYTRGKLHELVMKSYKSREFTAAISEVLDPWINAKQPRKDVEKLSLRKSEGDAHAAKRARLMVEGLLDGYEMEEIQSSIRDDSTFEDLCGDARFYKEKIASPESDSGSWALLDGHVLARIFHFLKSDLRSLSLASLTCKHWRAAVRFYKGISKQVDLSSMGSSCVDSMMWRIMNGYSKEKINSVVLLGCTSITPSAFEELLHVFPSICSLDVRGCNQFGDVVLKFPHINWLKNRSLPSSEESSGSIRSLNQTKESISSLSKKGLSGNVDDYGELKDYFERDSSFRRSLYRRSKVFDARKSSSISSRDARIRRWAMKKSENEYKRIEQFLTSSLRDIMKENAFDFFVPKVAEIEERIRNGYYADRGLSSVKEDISRMCRDAIKAKGRDMNHIITLFIQLATRLEQGARVTSSYERDELMRSWKDGNPTAVSKYKKKYSKLSNERKFTKRSNGSSFVNGTVNGEYASDREIRRRLSKLNRKSMGSESETSDDLDQSSEEGKRNASTSSDTESDLDFGSPIESKGGGYSTVDDGFESTTDDREWGARMTKASLVPPVTRKYEVIDQYVIVTDEEDVQRKMRVSLPEDYAEKLNAQKNGSEELDMELPEVKDYKPRKSLGDEVIEQEVYGIDPYTHNLLLDSMPEELDWPLLEKHLFIEDVLLQTLNKQARHFTGIGNTPMVYPLQPVVEEIKRVAEEDSDIRTMRICQGLLRAIEARPDDNYVAYRKGLGVVCNKESGFGEEDFIVEFLGEVYPVWKWFEKQDGIRLLQKNNKDAPEFYNIYLERPKGDADGYDLVVVDAMHKANYASRICHSCRPNCEAKVTAVDGHYQIGIYTVRGIQYGEEITFDYNSVTESKEEYEASVCLCGSQVCRGSYLNLTGEGAFQKVLEEWHGILDRQRLMLEACELNSVSEEDYLDLGRAGFGSCLLGGLPDWLIAYSARLVRFINFERTKLPEEILRHNLEEKRKYFLDTCLEVEKSDAEIQAEGVYNQRLQNLAVTLDKVRYVLRCVFGDPKKAPPPLERLNHEEVLAYLWKGEGSLVQELLESMAHHAEENLLNDLKAGVLAHDPSGSSDIEKGLRKSLLWLRDEVHDLPCTYKCRNDAAADLIHVHAYTKCFFKIREYKAVTSPPVYISPLDLGPKYADKFAVPQEYRKTYGENYCLGQLIYWYNQTNADPDRSLFRASKGCLSLPEIGSFYDMVQKPLQNRVYGSKTVKFMLSRMEKQPQRTWPKDRIWSFRSCPKVFGSPMMDAVINNAPLDREMVQWLRHRPAIFQAMWDRSVGESRV